MTFPEKSRLWPLKHRRFLKPGFLIEDNLRIVTVFFAQSKTVCKNCQSFKTSFQNFVLKAKSFLNKQSIVSYEGYKYKISDLGV